MAEMGKTFLETEVLVVGAGGAGLRAAIEAHSEGARVLIVAKGDFPSGCTPISMGGMLAAFGAEDSKELHFKDTVEGGDHLNNPRLVRLLVEHACERARDLEQIGTRFRKRGDEYLLFPYTGSSVPRGVVADAPYQGGYIKGLVKEVRRRGIEVIPHVMVADLLIEEQGVVGITGLAYETEALIVIAARAIVLATGGAGRIYSLTTNPSGTTGDGYALAYRAGAKIQDLEFVQGRVCMISPQGMRGTPPPGDGLVTQGGRFYNSLCERYMKRYHPEKLEQVTRAQMSICAQKEIQAGRHTPNMGVYGDLSGVPMDELSKYKRFMQSCAEEGFDPTWQPYEWAPGIHHFMGGVVINERCETDVPGLFAVGEAAGGVHGANRLAGNALTETQVFGTIAGNAAVERAWRSPEKGHIHSRAMDELEEKVEQIFARQRGESCNSVRKKLSEAMSRYLGISRNEEGLKEAAEALASLRAAEGELCLEGEKSLQSVSALFEVQNMLTVSELVVAAALMRKETRGAHNREDYPELDNDWTCNIVFQQVQGERSVKCIPVEPG